MKKEEIINHINNILEKAEFALKNKEFLYEEYFVKSNNYYEWLTTTKILLKSIPNSSYLEEINRINTSPYSKETAIEESVGVIKALKTNINDGLINVETQDNSIGLFITLDYIFNNFHRAARQLRSRYNNRNTLDIKDEYDVQDFLHTLLKLFFDDVRAEEYTPSYAGSASRMDFLLKNEKIVIEVKKTRDSLKDKELGNQLIEDIARYKGHPDCNKLICFVYDPEGLIGNPQGLSNDLNKTEDGFDVRVIIKP